MMDFHLPGDKKILSGPKKKKDKFKINPILLLKVSVFIVLTWSIIFFTYLVYTQRYRNEEYIFDIGLVHAEQYALHSLAIELGYLNEDYLQLNQEKYSTDKDALDELKRGRIDAAIVEDISLVSTLPEDGFKVIASVAKSDSYKFVVDLKKSIYSKNDLSGKRIGIANEDASKYWLSKNFKASDITIVFLDEKDLASKLANAEVDAILDNYPTIYEALNYEGNVRDAQAISQGRNTFSYAFLVTNQKNIKEFEYQLNLYLTALKQAGEYYKSNEVNSAQRLSNIWGREIGYSNYLLDDFDFVVNLNAGHRVQLTEQSKWKGSSLLKEDEINNMFSTSILRGISPESVSI